jgi:hypothetical protein
MVKLGQLQVVHYDAFLALFHPKMNGNMGSELMHGSEALRLLMRLHYEDTKQYSKSNKTTHCSPRILLKSHSSGGVHIALEGTTKDEVELIALGYRYSRKTILFFVLTKNAGTTQLGKPYHMKYTDSYGNVCTRYVDRPEVMSNYFAHSNTIDVHNQLRQDSLKLKKKWIMQEPFFCLGTTMIGINITNTYLLANYHGVINVSKIGNEEKASKFPDVCRYFGSATC